MQKTLHVRYLTQSNLLTPRALMASCVICDYNDFLIGLLWEFNKTRNAVSGILEVLNKWFIM